MANTFELIASTTVGAGGASTIDFTSIPSTYTDLVIKSSIRADNAAPQHPIQIRFNNNSTIADYDDLILFGNGSAADSIGNAGAPGIYWHYGNGDTATANAFASCEVYIPNYAGSNNKVASIETVTETNATAVVTIISNGLWLNSSAINRITLVPNASALFKQYTTSYLYGIKNS